MRWACLLVLLAACGRAPAAADQPIDFNHAIHVVDEEVPCTDCHVGAETGVHATLPALSTCLLCHMKPQGDEPNEREQAVRDLAAAKTPLRWTQVTRNAGHVYFSHRAHVSIAELPCADCHGDVSTWTRPPTAPDERLMSMDACMACHRERGVSNECDTCHQ